MSSTEFLSLKHAFGSWKMKLRRNVKATNDQVLIIDLDLRNLSILENYKLSNIPFNRLMRDRALAVDDLWITLTDGERVMNKTWKSLKHARLNMYDNYLYIDTFLFFKSQLIITFSDITVNDIR